LKLYFFSVQNERAAISEGNVQGDWGYFPNERKMALYYKDTARAVTRKNMEGIIEERDFFAKWDIGHIF
jgi:hypothetical protein